MLQQLLLFAQEGSGFAGNRPDPALIVIAFCVCGAIIAVGCTYFGCKHASKQRELEHVERIKAIEMGQDPDARDDEKKYRNGVFWISFWIGFIVPLVAIGGATAATKEADLNSIHPIRRLVGRHGDRRRRRCQRRVAHALVWRTPGPHPQARTRRHNGIPGALRRSLREQLRREVTLAQIR